MNGSFELQIVPKHPRRLAGFDFGAGPRRGGLPVTGLAGTDRVSVELEAWRTRPLDAIYAVMYIDCIHIGTHRIKDASRRGSAP